jgi:hypothetical protein
VLKLPTNITPVGAIQIVHDDHDQTIVFPGRRLRPSGKLPGRIQKSKKLYRQDNFDNNKVEATPSERERVAPYIH